MMTSRIDKSVSKKGHKKGMNGLLCHEYSSTRSLIWSASSVSNNQSLIRSYSLFGRSCTRSRETANCEEQCAPTTSGMVALGNNVRKTEEYVASFWDRLSVHLGGDRGCNSAGQPRAQVQRRET